MKSEQEEIRTWRYLLNEAQTCPLENVDAMKAIVDLARFYAMEERITVSQRMIIGEIVMDRYSKWDKGMPFIVN